MGKLTAKEKNRVKIEVRQIVGPQDRGLTWVGYKTGAFCDKRRKKLEKAQKKELACYK